MNDFNPYTHIPEMPNCIGTYALEKFTCDSCSYAISCIEYRDKQVASSKTKNIKGE